jgi:hypothetical protein
VFLDAITEYLVAKVWPTQTADDFAEGLAQLGVKVEWPDWDANHLLRDAASYAARRMTVVTMLGDDGYTQP